MMTSESKAARIWRCISECGPLTCDEVELLLLLPHQTVSARISELVNCGRLRIRADKRISGSGRRARVYEATQPN